MLRNIESGSLNPLNIPYINMEIQEVNDNAPLLSRNVTKLNFFQLTQPQKLL